MGSFRFLFFPNFKNFEFKVYSAHEVGLNYLSLVNFVFFSISLELRCDGIQQCYDKSDERNCGNGFLTNSDYIKDMPPIQTGKCIMNYKIHYEIFQFSYDRLNSLNEYGNLLPCYLNLY